MRFDVDKLSAVQIVITHENGKTSLNKTATFARGAGSFTWKPGATGIYTVTLSAKELGPARACARAPSRPRSFSQ